VDDLTRADDHYVITAGARRLQARHVVVATGAYTTPLFPAFAGQLDPAIIQLHSVEYRNSGQLRDGPVLVVGAGNSGAEIAYDLAATCPTWLAGRDTGMIPGELGSVGHQVGALVFRAVAQRLTVDTLPGRWLVGKARGLTGGHPVVRLRPEDLLKAGVQRVPRVAGVSNGRPVLESGQALDVANVVWATGFVRDFSWIRLPVFDAGGTPRHHRGMVQTEPGLYFAGLPFQSSLLSGLVAGAGPDARYIVQQITARDRAAHPTLARRPQRLPG
jgi:putative flavoprotein involved in K+ transport